MKSLEMKLALPADKKSRIAKFVRTFREAGYECFLVGGSVRDLILERHGSARTGGRDSGDFDFATNARPEEVRGLFRKVIPTGEKHGTMTVLAGGGLAFEVTTYRADGTYADGRRPEEVRFSDRLEEDVKRRDFTINGLAYDLERDEIIDLVGGLADIEKKIVRTIGNPLERFGEDGLRPYRACRIAAKFDFSIEAETFAAIGKSLETASRVSMERVRDELTKLLAVEKPSIGIEFMRQSGLLDLFLPELSACHGIIQNKYHRYDIYWHSLYSCDFANRREPFIRLAALLHDLGKLPTRREQADGESTFYNHEVIGARITRRVMKRLKYSNDEITHVSNLVSNHMFHYTDAWTDGAVRRFMRKVGMENLEDLIALRMADRLGNGMRGGMPQPIRELRKRIDRIIEEQNAITVRDLDINGHVIMEEFGIKPGPIIGAILSQLLELVLDSPEMNVRSTLMEKAREIFESIKDEPRYTRD